MIMMYEQSKDNKAVEKVGRVLVLFIPGLPI